MIRQVTMTLLSAAALAMAASPLHAEGPGDDGKRQEMEAKREAFKKDMRALEDKQRQEQRDLEDRHQKERKSMHDKHRQEHESLKQKMAPK